MLVQGAGRENVRSAQLSNLLNPPPLRPVNMVLSQFRISSNSSPLLCLALQAPAWWAESPPRLRTRPRSRWASASCAAKFCRSLRLGCHSDGSEPKLQERCGARACGSRSPAAADWPSYNKTLTSERFSDLSQINTQRRQLKVFAPTTPDNLRASRPA